MSSRRRAPPRERGSSPIPTGNPAAVMEAILSRLATLEQRAETRAATPPVLALAEPAQELAMSAPRGESVASTLGATSAPRGESVASTSGATRYSAVSTASMDVTERLIDALKSINPVRSNHYYVSDFDPSVHDAHAWCDEVDRAQSQNQWDEKECLARVGLSLKGDARSWLREWTSNNRTWSNFKLELKSLCPRRVDVANILFSVMCNESDKYSTYADYA